MAEQGAILRVACVQMRSGLDRADNVSDAAAMIETAAKDGAQFIATPEMTNIVDRKGARLVAALPEAAGLSEIETFAALAKRLEVWLLIGSMAVRAGERAANRAYLYSPAGDVAATYDKIHMFDVDLPGGESWKESKIYQPGDRAVLVETPIAKVGLSICYDVRFPDLYRGLARAGADILCVPAAFTAQTGRAHWRTLLTARAIENGAFVVAPGQGGRHADGRETWGRSAIIGPWGEMLAYKDDDAPGVISADLNLDDVTRARARIPSLSLEQSCEVAIISI